MPNYLEMTDDKIKQALKEIIDSSSSKMEVERRLRDELHYTFGIVMNVLRNPGAPKDCMFRDALWQAMIRGPRGTISITG